METSMIFYPLIGVVHLIIGGVLVIKYARVRDIGLICLATVFVIWPIIHIVVSGSISVYQMDKAVMESLRNEDSSSEPFDSVESDVETMMIMSQIQEFLTAILFLVSVSLLYRRKKPPAPPRLDAAFP